MPAFFALLHPPEVIFNLLLALPGPGRVVPLRDSHALMSQQNRDALKWNSGKQCLDRESLAETVCVSARNFGKVKKQLERALPIPYGTFHFLVSSPEEIRSVFRNSL